MALNHWHRRGRVVRSKLDPMSETRFRGSALVNEMRLCFASLRDHGALTAPQGGRAARVLAAFSYQPDWSPDGRQLAFGNGPGGAHTGLAVAIPTGGRLRPIPNTREGTAPRHFHDGRHVVYMHGLNPRPADSVASRTSRRMARRCYSSSADEPGRCRYPTDSRRSRPRAARSTGSLEPGCAPRVRVGTGWRGGLFHPLPAQPNWRVPLWPRQSGDGQRRRITSPSAGPEPGGSFSTPLARGPTPGGPSASHQPVDRRLGGRSISSRRRVKLAQGQQYGAHRSRCGPCRADRGHPRPGAATTNVNERATDWMRRFSAIEVAARGSARSCPPGESCH